MATASLLDSCPSSPSDGQHECMPGEMRCVYCAVRLDPYPCHHCGKFLAAAQMFRVSQGENARCNELDDSEPFPASATPPTGDPAATPATKGEP